MALSKYSVVLFFSFLFFMALAAGPASAQNCSATAVPACIAAGQQNVPVTFGSTGVCLSVSNNGSHNVLVPNGSSTSDPNASTNLKTEYNDFYVRVISPNNPNPVNPIPGISVTSCQCPAQTMSWTVGSASCSADLAATAFGKSAVANEPSAKTPNSSGGSSSYTCNNGTWVQQAGATCTSCTGYGFDIVGDPESTENSSGKSGPTGPVVAPTSGILGQRVSGTPTNLGSLHTVVYESSTGAIVKSTGLGTWEGQSSYFGYTEVVCGSSASLSVVKGGKCFAYGEQIQQCNSTMPSATYCVSQGGKIGYSDDSNWYVRGYFAAVPSCQYNYQP